MKSIQVRHDNIYLSAAVMRLSSLPSTDSTTRSYIIYNYYIILLLPGVWVGENKIAAIGVSATNWVSSHGFSLNVAPNLDFFDTSLILPCGIEGRGITSMQQELLLADQNKVCPSVASVAEVVLQKMAQVFQIQVDDPSKFTTIF
jgi:lipoate-protein ligase B